MTGAPSSFGWYKDWANLQPYAQKITSNLINHNYEYESYKLGCPGNDCEEDSDNNYYVPEIPEAEVRSWRVPNQPEPPRPRPSPPVQYEVTYYNNNNNNNQNQKMLRRRTRKRMRPRRPPLPPPPPPPPPPPRTTTTTTTTRAPRVDYTENEASLDKYFDLSLPNFSNIPPLSYIFPGSGAQDSAEAKELRDLGPFKEHEMTFPSFPSFDSYSFSSSPQHFRYRPRPSYHHQQPPAHPMYQYGKMMMNVDFTPIFLSLLPLFLALGTLLGLQFPTASATTTVVANSTVPDITVNVNSSSTATNTNNAANANNNTNTLVPIIIFTNGTVVTIPTLIGLTGITLTGITLGTIGLGGIFGIPIFGRSFRGPNLFEQLIDTGKRKILVKSHNS